MPTKQLYGQLEKSLGMDWRSKLGAFDETPIAAASIGQVKPSRQGEYCTRNLGEEIVIFQQDSDSRLNVDAFDCIRFQWQSFGQDIMWAHFLFSFVAKLPRVLSRPAFIFCPWYSTWFARRYVFTRDVGKQHVESFVGGLAVRPTPAERRHVCSWHSGRPQ